MAIGNETSLLFRIKGDASDAVRAFNDVDRHAKGLTSTAGGLGGTLSSLAGPAAIAGAGLATIAAGALAGTTALFNLTKNAADFGSEIFDATEKTGASAEALSAMKFAAEQSGTSFEKVTASIVKFNILLAESKDGSEKAEATLKKYGITATDVDGALTQALKAVAEITDADKQAAAAKELFKDKTAELLPYIRSFGGDLAELTRKTKELGVAIDGDAARAADEFGDQMDTLNAQLGAVAMVIGRELMPVFMELATELSKWLQSNPGEIKFWAGAIEASLRGVIWQWKMYAWAIQQARNLLSGDYGLLTAPPTLDIDGSQTPQAPGAPREASSVPTSRRNGGTDSDTAANRPKAPNVINIKGEGSEDGTFKRDNRKYLSGQEAEDAAEARRYYMASTEFFAAEVKKRIALAEQAAVTGKKTAAEVAKFIDDQERIVTDNKRKYLADYLAKLKAGSDEYAQVQQQLSVLDEEIAARKIELDTNEIVRIKEKAAEEKKLRDERNQSFNDYVQNLIKIQEMEDAERQRRAEEEAEINRKKIEGQGVTTGTGIGAGIAGGLGVELPSIFGPQDEILSQADFIKSVYGDVSDFAGQAIGSMVQGLANLVTQWIITGKFSAKAALQMAAGIALGVAQQAVVKAIFEVAEGMAALARLDPATASLHFAAAKVYGTTAAIAGAAGVGLALGARAAGGGSNQASQAFAGQTSPVRRNTDGQGQGWSSQNDGTQNAGINAPGGNARMNPFQQLQQNVALTLKVTMDRNGMFQVMQDSVKSNGIMRDIIIDGTGG